MFSNLLHPRGCSGQLNQWTIQMQDFGGAALKRRTPTWRARSTWELGHTDMHEPEVRLQNPWQRKR